MSWETELQDASFRGVLFECTSTDDSQSKTLAIHQAPYSDDAEIEDMGNDPRKISINAVFAGDNYLSGYYRLEAALNEKGPGELVHPIFGIMNVQVSNYSVRHDEQNYDSCILSIEFLRAKAQVKEFFIPSEFSELDLESVLENPASALELALEKLKVLDNNKFVTVMNKIRTGLQNVHKYMGIGKNFIEKLLSPQAWAVGLIDDITRLVTFDTSISAFSKWRDLNNRVKRIGSFFSDDDDDNNVSTPVELKQLLNTIQVISAVAVTKGVIANIRAEMAENKEISLTPDELAVIRQQNRNAINEAILVEREKINSMEAIAQIQYLKALADEVHVQIQSIIDVRPNLSKTTILVPCSVHWLAHYLYDDMSRASEIRRLNPGLHNPSLLDKGMEVAVYAR